MRDYPSDHLLKWFSEYDVLENGPCDLIHRIKENWEYGDMGYFSWDPRRRLLRLSTAGWSGNEDIICALQSNFLFWQYWINSHVGGHYVFRIRKIEGVPE